MQLNGCPLYMISHCSPWTIIHTLAAFGAGHQSGAVFYASLVQGEGGALIDTFLAKLALILIDADIEDVHLVKYRLKSCEWAEKATLYPAPGQPGHYHHQPQKQTDKDNGLHHGLEGCYLNKLSNCFEGAEPLAVKRGKEQG